MSDAETKENVQTKKKEKVLFILIPIIVAIIGALGIIIVGLLPKEIDVNICIKDANTGQNIPGVIFIDDDKNPTSINPATGTTVSLKNGKYTIRAESKGYHPHQTVIDRVPRELGISLEKIAVITNSPIPLSFAGWKPWNDEITLKAGASANEIIINGATADSTGFYKSDLPPILRGKTLVLYFSNTKASHFSRNRMIKLEYNINDTPLYPTNASLEHKEYLTNEDTPLNNGIEYSIPNDFAGKLIFTFYQAELKDLKITAYYK